MARVVDKLKELGAGSYGKVYHVKYNKCNYAAKFIYEHLLEPDFPTNRQKFDVNCKNLKYLSHTCIVRYIDIIIDHETRLPVLIMELCDKNLTEFLKQYSSKPLPYHVELNIGLDIAQALQYLHGHVPKILHSNLTSNNIFVVTGPRVKVCDFGMSTLGFAKPKESPCPEYKSPEALNKPPTLSEKLDVFSFGVLLLQILTRLPPNPTDRFRAVPDNAGNIIEISETDRRSDHLGRIAKIHPLKPTILRCLENADRHRPTAAELVVSLKSLRGEEEFTKSYERELHKCRSQREVEQSVRRGTLVEDDVGVKLLVLGQSGVGKSLLLHVYDGHQFRTLPYTVGCDVITKTVTYKGKPVKLEIWDSAGLEKFHALTNAHFRGAKGALVVYDVTNQDSHKVASRWIDATRLNAGDAEIVLVGNKTDLVSRRVVGEMAGRDLAHEHGIAYIETSALKDENLHEAFDMLVETIMMNTRKFSERDTHTLRLGTRPPPVEESKKKSCCKRN